MKRIFLITNIFLSSALAVYAQSAEYKLTDQQQRTLDNIISENYIGIRDLRIPLMNFGGGKEQYNKLVESFSNAFAKYMNENKVESMNLFKNSNKDINNTAVEIAKKYQKDANEIYEKGVRVVISNKFERSASANFVETGFNLSAPPDFYIKSAAQQLSIGNKHLADNEAIDSIYYFRRAKDFVFQCFNEIKYPIDDQYKKDIADNRGEQFIGEKEKNK
jgi:hypothetical protein